MKKKNNMLFFGVLFFVTTVEAQITNTGKLTISPGTVFSSKFNFENSSSGAILNDGELVILSDFNNDGLVFFTDSQYSNTKFIGKKNQRITGSSPAEFTKFNDLIFDNDSKQPAFIVSGKLSVSGNTDFRKGIVNTGRFNGSIVYEIDANHFNTSNESHIEGYAEKKGNTDFTFPIGDKSLYRYAKITSINASAGSSIIGKYFLENSNLSFPHSSRAGNLEQIDNKQYWEIENHSGYAEIMITLSWDKETTSDFIWKDLKNMMGNEDVLTIVRWDKDKKLWIDEGGVAEVNDNESGTVTTFSKISGFGIFALAKIKRSTKNDGYVFVYNAVSPNNDGKNDFFKIEGIQKYPNNRVTIFNRWGAKVFETTNYDSRGNVFNGYSQSQGKSEFNNDSTLPTGTYFYVLSYEVKSGEDSRNVEKVGYLYISDN
ncbi:gliding motility-associated C-terminal domain-containing protein [Flavobacterium lipolyticum]|uniref:Gliding motility-associated C-terminal domain-containing protein n=1 Tax=Flavobacterium lipolyticum TaxID=2893754 RepID=A0ABS8M412_9FLAO|nr:gliding motility-associated C-terminal domain-containing protein [Flavobacterium sp. F-126]MCC9019556.1 gliding motility-associated C-terminal domain-containing protein [Flavobacterium sp. F-126]